MAPPSMNVLGMRFGRLLFLERAGSNRLGPLWRVACDCGQEFVSNAGPITGGKKRSCGCLYTEAASRMGSANRRHGMTHTTEYNIWMTMKARCGNPSHISYRAYGGRGIKVCQRWESFDNFFADMGVRPPGHSLDRIDNDGDYEPGNCRWATMPEQARNSTIARHVTIGDRSQCIVDWLLEFGISAGTYYSRRRSGWGEVESLVTPPDRRRKKRRRAIAPLSLEMAEA